MQQARALVQAFVQAVHNEDGAQATQFLKITNNAQTVAALRKLLDVNYVRDSRARGGVFCFFRFLVVSLVTNGARRLRLVARSFAGRVMRSLATGCFHSNVLTRHRYSYSSSSPCRSRGTVSYRTNWRYCAQCNNRIITPFSAASKRCSRVSPMPSARKGTGRFRFCTLCVWNYATLLLKVTSHYPQLCEKITTDNCCCCFVLSIPQPIEMMRVARASTFRGQDAI